MVTLDIKDYEPPNPFEHAANALDDLAFIAKWPRRMREARLTVVKVLVALRDIEKLPGAGAVLDAVTSVAMSHALRDSVEISEADASRCWTAMADAILKDAPPELLEAVNGS